MKKLKTKWRMLVNSVLTSVLGIVGISSCSPQQAPLYGPPIPDNNICLYGTPYAVYEVMGNVVNKQNEPLDSMQVVVKNVGDYEHLDYDPTVTDTVYTNAYGKYLSNYELTAFGDDTLRVTVHDPKGVYQSDSVDIAPNEMDWIADDGWNSQLKVKANFKLKKK